MSTRLKEGVWALDRCCGCGDCVALCSKGVLVWDSDESPTVQEREKALGLSHTKLDTCSICQKFCEEGCPRLVEEWPARESRQVVAVRTKGLVQSGEPGDVIKHLLVPALSAGLLDGVVLMDLDPWTLQPIATVATTVGEVMDTLGVQYLWGPTLGALNEAVYEKALHRLGVVGTPCVSQGLRRLSESDNERLNPYRRALKLNIATFCTGVYRPAVINGFLTDALGVELASIKRLQASPRNDQLTALLWDGSTKTIPLTQMESYTRHGCARCDDYFGESADIAVGTVGARDGYSTLIVRSPAGETCLRHALDFDLLEVSDDVDQAALRQAQEEKDRRRRAQAFDKLAVMMLDALGEPRKRAEVKREFVRLYEVQKPAEWQSEEASCGTCAQC